MTTEHPPRPPRAGYYWQLDECGWREVRPVNWFWLSQYYAKQRKNDDSITRNTR